MKSFIYIVILMCTSNIFAQSSSIENDALFLKYEKEYLNPDIPKCIDNYEMSIRNFYGGFKEARNMRKFDKSKDKSRWLSRNLSKTNFKNAEDALQKYHQFLEATEDRDSLNKRIQDTRNELLKKYDEVLIWETLQRRISSK